MASPFTFRIYNDDEIETWPEPRWLIANVLPAESFILLHGEPGTGKSFVALDWALSIAAGQPWHGREVDPGAVVYVYAEGQSGLKLRVRAWKQHHGVARIPNARFVPVAVQIHKYDDVNGFISAVTQALPRVPIRLIVIDTLARCFAGGDENSQRDMGLFVSGADAIRQRTGAAVLVVHHDARDTGRTRGSTALPGAADTIIGTTNRTVAKADAPPRVLVSLTCTKQKDADAASEIRLQLTRVELGRDTNNQPLTSCVLTAPSVDALAEGRRLSDTERAVLRALPASGATYAEWLEAASGVPESSFKRAKKRLIDDGYIVRPPDPTPRGWIFQAATPWAHLVAQLDPPDEIDWAHYDDQLECPGDVAA